MTEFERYLLRGGRTLPGDQEGLTAGDRYRNLLRTVNTYNVNRYGGRALEMAGADIDQEALTGKPRPGVLSTAFKVLDAPRRGLFKVMGVDPELTGGDVFRQADADSLLGKVGRYAGAFAFDVATDPLTYFGGISTLGRRSATLTAVAPGVRKAALEAAEEGLTRRGKDAGALVERLYNNNTLVKQAAEQADLLGTPIKGSLTPVRQLQSRIDSLKATGIADDVATSTVRRELAEEELGRIVSESLLTEGRAGVLKNLTRLTGDEDVAREIFERLPAEVRGGIAVRTPLGRQVGVVPGTGRGMLLGQAGIQANLARFKASAIAGRGTSVLTGGLGISGRYGPAWQEVREGLLKSMSSPEFDILKNNLGRTTITAYDALRRAQRSATTARVTGLWSVWQATGAAKAALRDWEDQGLADEFYEAFEETFNHPEAGLTGQMTPARQAGAERARELAAAMDEWKQKQIAEGIKISDRGPGYRPLVPTEEEKRRILESRPRAGGKKDMDLDYTPEVSRTKYIEPFTDPEEAAKIGYIIPGTDTVALSAKTINARLKRKAFVTDPVQVAQVYMERAAKNVASQRFVNEALRAGVLVADENYVREQARFERLANFMAGVSKAAPKTAARVKAARDEAEQALVKQVSKERLAETVAQTAGRRTQVAARREAALNVERQAAQALNDAVQAVEAARPTNAQIQARLVQYGQSGVEQRAAAAAREAANAGRRLERATRNLDAANAEVDTTREMVAAFGEEAQPLADEAFETAEALVDPFILSKEARQAAADELAAARQVRAGLRETLTSEEMRQIATFETALKNLTEKRSQYDAARAARVEASAEWAKMRKNPNIASHDVIDTLARDYARKNAALKQARMDYAGSGVGEEVEEAVTVGVGGAVEKVPAVAPGKPFAQAVTGQPVEGVFYRGTGGIGPDGGRVMGTGDESVLGPGLYASEGRSMAEDFASDQRTGEIIGEVTQIPIRLENPLVISTDEQWKELTKEAGWQFPILERGFTEDIPAELARLRRVIDQKGHDGVVVRVSEKAFGLEIMFSESQIVAFDAVKATTPRPVAAKVARKKTSKAADDTLKVLADDAKRARKMLVDAIGFDTGKDAPLNVYRNKVLELAEKLGSTDLAAAQVISSESKLRDVLSQLDDAFQAGDVAAITRLTEALKETYFNIRDQVTFEDLTGLRNAEVALLRRKTPGELQLTEDVRRFSPFGEWLNSEDMRNIANSVESGDVSLPRRLAGLHASSGVRAVLENMYRAERTGVFRDHVNKVLDPLLLLWKTGVTVGRGPAYVITNTIGGIYMSFLGNVSVKSLAESGRVLVSFKTALKEAANEMPKASAPEQYERAFEIMGKKLAGVKVGDRDAVVAFREFWERGGYGATQTAEALQLLSRYGSRAPSEALTYGETVRQQAEEATSAIGRGFQKVVDVGLTNPYQRVMNDAAQTSELFLRFGTYVDTMKKFNDPELAYDRVNLLHFDYTDLSEAEESIRRLVPFYTWVRHNVPAQLRAVVLDPGKMKKWMYAQQEFRAMMEDDEDSWYQQMLPEYLQDVGGFASRISTSAGPLAFGSRMPYDDVERLLKVGGWPIPRNELAKMIGPLATLPLSITTGTNLDTGAKFGGEGVEATGYQLPLSYIPGLGTTGERGERRFSETASYAISEALPQLSIIDRLLSTTPVTRPLASKQQQERALSNFLNLSGAAALTGQSVTTLTEGAITGEARRRIEKQNVIIDKAAGQLGISVEWLRQQIRAGKTDREIAVMIRQGQGKLDEFEREKLSRRQPLDRRYQTMLRAMGQGRVDLGY